MGEIRGAQGVRMSGRLSRCLFVGASLLFPLSLCAQKDEAKLWLTNADRSALFQQQEQSFRFSSAPAQQPAIEMPTIEINDQQIFQTIDGFGFALTWGSAEHLFRMDPAKRDALLNELFGTAGQDIGISYLRVSIGASDLNEYVYSYDDVPAGQSDPELTKFSLDEDRKYVIPILKAILKIQPNLKI